MGRARRSTRSTRALDGIDPADVRLHVCWGNYEGPHTHDVPLDDIQSLLYQARVGALVLSMANARHAHEYRCFERRPLPDDMVLVAGVIDTTSNYVEHPEVVAERLVGVAERGRRPAAVIAGTDCGFDTTAGIGDVAPSVVWEKLRALRVGADLASTRLFPAAAGTGGDAAGSTAPTQRGRPLRRSRRPARRRSASSTRTMRCSRRRTTSTSVSGERCASIRVDLRSVRDPADGSCSRTAAAS